MSRLPLASTLRVIVAAALAAACGGEPQTSGSSVGARSAPVLSIDGLEFRDLDRDGAPTPYEDWRLSAAARAADLVSPTG